MYYIILKDGVRTKTVSNMCKVRCATRATVRCEAHSVWVRPVQFLQCRRWLQIRRALAIIDATPRRVPLVGGWDGARSLARAHCVPALRRRGTGPRQTPRHGAIIRSAAAVRLWVIFFFYSTFSFQGRSRPTEPLLS